ncbi:MAG: hypothetical protein WAL41_11855 [Mycobacterium sp.]
MTMRVKSRALNGEAVKWDGTNAAELAALAGDRFEGTYASSALVRGRDGELIHVRPGWTVACWDGADGVTVSSAGAWAALAEDAL